MDHLPAPTVLAVPRRATLLGLASVLTLGRVSLAVADAPTEQRFVVVILRGAMDGLSAVVPYYGKQPAVEDVSRIKASLMLQYAGNDEWINKGIPAFEEALKKASVDYRIFRYEGAQHAFNNDTNPARYNKEAAQLAWERTIAFFKEKLKN